MLRSHITQGFVDEALDFITRARDEGRPFYVNLWPDDVHGPLWHPAERWSGDVREQRYLAVLEGTDAQLGGLFDAVRGNPDLAESILILVCSDNGPARGQGRAGFFRGYKAQLHEGGIRSPLVAWGSGLVEEAGTVNGESVLSAMVLVPTLLELAGADPHTSAAYDGEALSDTLLGPAVLPASARPGRLLRNGRPPRSGHAPGPLEAALRVRRQPARALPPGRGSGRVPQPGGPAYGPGPGHVPGAGCLAPGHARGPGSRARLGPLAHARRNRPGRSLAGSPQASRAHECPFLARRAAPRLAVHTISRRYEALDGDDVVLGIRHLWLVRGRQQQPQFGDRAYMPEARCQRTNLMPFPFVDLKSPTGNRPSSLHSLFPSIPCRWPPKGLPVSPRQKGSGILQSHLEPIEMETESGSAGKSRCATLGVESLPRNSLPWIEPGSHRRHATPVTQPAAPEES